jgi:fumarylacetoacetate (FAA) hydrolase family protein
MHELLTPAASLPADRDRALLVGRIFDPVAGGPVLVGIEGDAVVDLSHLAPTCTELLEHRDPAGAVRATRGLTPHAPLADVLANSACDRRDPAKTHFLAPCDLQALKAAGVTFVASMLERVIEEQARGDAS